MSPTPLDDRDIDALQACLDAVPAPLEPLDVSSLDGFLCGVIVQPQRVAPERWLAHVADVDGRLPPAGFDGGPLHELVRRRHAELEAAIVARRWFDPWVFGGGDGDGDGGESGNAEADDAQPVEAVYPWVAGIATAFELFPGVMELPPEATLEPLALLYRHLDAGDLEDADALIEEIESLEPPADLATAVEELVRATLLLADASRPTPARGATARRRPAPVRSSAGRRRSPSG